VIIACHNAVGTIAACLQSLRNQATDADFEVIVVDSSTDGTAELVASGFPEVQLHTFSARRFCGGARNWGVAQSRADIVAFTDADCVPDRDWVDQLLLAHQAPHAAIGGTIANANPASCVGWGAYFTEFSHWIPGQQPHWLRDIAGANMSYKRDLFQRYGSFIEGTYCSDTEFHWRLGRDGLQLRFEPAIVVAHRSIEQLGPFLRHEFAHGRSFGRMRVRAQAFPAWRRALYVVCGPLIPLRRLARVVGNNLRGQAYLRQFIAAFPLVVLGVSAWCLGEVVAYAGA
jgi:GT2 family glycosyltransferase